MSKVRAGKKAVPSKQGLPPPRPAQPYTFASPTRGWILNENLSAAQPGGATILDNWIPGTKSIKVRGGNARYATLGGTVTGLFSYKSGGAETFFGATAAAIYDISSVADPDTPPATVVSGLGGGDFSTQMFTTSGGDFLYVVNGVNKAQLFDGATWTAIDSGSTPAITGVATTSLNFVWSFANRLWFVQKNTTKAWYLPTSAVGGAAVSFELGTVFNKGATLLFGGSWSNDSGSGLDDRCIFVSSDGEVAVYQGTDPSSATTWSKVGVYQITTPIGKNCTMRAGGDMLIGTTIGLVPISAAVMGDIGALDLAAVSRAIDPYWKESVAATSTTKWQIAKFPAKNIFVVSQPQDSAGSWLLCNLATKAWARGVGMVTNCLGNFGEDLYFGSTDSRVYKMETTGYDDTASYTAIYLGQHEQMGAGWVAKTVEQARAIFSSGSIFVPQISAKTNYDVNPSAPPNGVIYDSDGLWDTGLWDVMLWDSGSPLTSYAMEWKQIGRSGLVAAPEVQITIGNMAKPDIEFIAMEAMIRTGSDVY